jgi:hypothetical protein
MFGSIVLPTAGQATATVICSMIDMELESGTGTAQFRFFVKILRGNKLSLFRPDGVN